MMKISVSVFIAVFLCATTVSAVGNVVAEGSGWKVCFHTWNSLNYSKRDKAYDYVDGWKECLVGLSDEPYHCVHYDSIDFAHGDFPHQGRHYRFAVVATGIFPVQSAGTYDFKICGDDGVHIIIDGEVASTAGWKLQGRRCYTISVTLSAGSHSIKAIMYENHGREVMQLYGGPGKTSNEPMEILSAPVTGLCFNNEKYFTLGEASAISSEKQCQSGAIALPAWAALAPNDETSRTLVENSLFGTDCLVLADGTAHKTAEAASAGATETTVALPEDDDDTDASDDTTVKKKNSKSSKFEQRDISAVEWSVDLVSRSVSNGATTFRYRVTVLGTDVHSGAKDLSHWTLGIGAGCDMTHTVFGAHAVDPTTGLAGVKYDSQLNKGASYEFDLIVSGDQASQTIEYAVKGGTYYAIGSVSGPLCGASSTAPQVQTSTLVADTQCGTGKLLGDASGYSADCSDSVPRRVLAKKAGCDPGDIDVGQHTITNYVVLNGKRYATLDNAVPNEEDTAGCGTKVGVVPAGWTIASFNSETAMLNLFGGSLNKFGTSCMIFADGKGRSNVVGSYNEICATDAIQSAPVVDTTILRVFNHWCPARIVITQDAANGEANTYEFEHSADIQKTSAVMGFHYANVDNTATSSGASGCQMQPFALPDGWEIVPESSLILSKILRLNNMRTSCAVTGDGVGAPTGSSSECGSGMLRTHVHNGKIYYTVNSCDARVLMRHTEIFDESALAETCGVCTGWGDPHLTTFDGTRYDSYGSEAILKVVELSAGMDPCTAYNQPAWKCNFGVYAWQVPLHRVATNKAVVVKYQSESGLEETVQVIVDHTIKLRSNVPDLKLNHAVTTLELGESITMAGGAVVSRVRGRRNRLAYRVELPNAVSVEVTPGFWKQPLMDYVVRLPKLFRGSQTVHGLCGDCDGAHGNDYYDPMGDTVVGKNTITGSRKDRKSKIQNDFVNKNVVTGSNPFDETVVVPPPVDVSPEDPEVCDLVTAKVLDQVDVCCSELKDEEYDLCRDEVCINGGCDSLETLDDVKDAIDEVITGTKAEETVCDYASPLVSIQADLEMGGRYYSTVDGGANSAVVSTETISQFFAVPEGWRIAERDEINLANLPCLAGLSECLVFADGSGVTTDGSFKACGKSLIVRSGEAGRCVRSVDALTQRVLITKDVDTIVRSAMEQSCFSGEGCFWYKENEGDVVTYPAEEDPMAGQVAEVSSTNEFQVNGIHRTWTFSAPNAPNKRTAPFSASVWVKTDGLAVYDDEETYYVQTDLYVDSYVGSNQVVMSFRTDYFSSNYQYPETETFANGGSRQVTHGWERVVVDFNLAKLYSLYGLTSANPNVNRIVMHLVVKRAVGTVSFGEPHIGDAVSESFNLVTNGDFNQPMELTAGEGNSFRGWVPVNGNSAVSTDSSASGLGSHPDGGSGHLVLSGEDKNEAATMKWFAQPAGADNGYSFAIPDNFVMCMWHKAENIIGSERSTSSIYVDLLGYNPLLGSNVNSYANVLPTQVGTGGWYHSCSSFSTDAEYLNRLSVTARMNDAGEFSKSHFDGVYILPTCSGTKTKIMSTSFGDPHYVTADGVKYDSQHIGEYRLYEDDTMRVQHRHSRAGNAAVISAIAVEHYITGARVQIDRPAQNELEPTVRVNGAKVDMKDQYSLKTDTGLVRIVRTGSLSAADAGFGSLIRYTIELSGTYSGYDENAEFFSVDVKTSFRVSVHNTIYGTSFLQAGFTKHLDLPYNVPQGLLGAVQNGDASDDLTLPDGTVADPSVKEEVDSFVEAWRVKSAKASIFVYPRGTNFETFYDPTFTPLDLDSFTEDQIFNAATTCRNAGVGANVMQSCIYDVLSGGEGYAVGSAGLSTEFSTASEPVYDDVLPPELVGDSTDDSTTTQSALGWAFIASILGSVFFTSIACCVLAGCVAVVLARLFKVAGWSLVNREERKAMLPTHFKETGNAVNFDDSDGPVIQRQLSNAVNYVAELLAGEKSPAKKKRYSSLLNDTEEGRNLSDGSVDSDTPSVGRSATMNPVEDASNKVPASSRHRSTPY